MFPKPMSNAIDIQNLVVEFPGARGSAVRALQGLSLSVAPGQVYGFLGPNGAGKTTTMHVLLGFIEATAGAARLFDEDVRQTIARRRIGYLPEQPDTYRFLTGRELLLTAGRLFGLSRAARNAQADELLALVGLETAANRRLATYSRGMLQRIGLAQALVNDPDLVILDEPASGLDPLGRLRIREIIAVLRKRGKTVFFSSHELSEVERVCDCVGILANGRLVAEGRVAELVKAGESLEQYFIKAVS
ncbi:MAG: ABC transporter ATP-binding protein [Kiritimatiellae bacterium]|nr:ABC transporter ATP-binding protein [Kiritimatiellia bacterium]